MGTNLTVRYSNAVIPAANYDRLREMLGNGVDGTPETPEVLAERIEEFFESYAGGITVTDDGIDIDDLSFDGSTSWGHATDLQKFIDLCAPGSLMYQITEDGEHYANRVNAQGIVIEYSGEVIYPGLKEAVAADLCGKVTA